MDRAQRDAAEVFAKTGRSWPVSAIIASSPSNIIHTSTKQLGISPPHKELHRDLNVSASDDTAHEAVAEPISATICL